jgi:hypothetical protein
MGLIRMAVVKQQQQGQRLDVLRNKEMARSVVAVGAKLSTAKRVMDRRTDG